MILRQPAEVLVLLLPALLFALCFHEFSHAYMAYRLGDNTAAHAGRLTLNPLAHLDIMGSIMILFVGFGWAKPVPVNPRFFSNPRKDMMLVAFAGPVSNLFLALIGGVIIRIINVLHINTGQTIASFLFYFILVNISLAVFNMLPIPPLDGSRIFSGLLVNYIPDIVQKLNQYGPMVLLGLIIFGMVTNFSILWFIMYPFVKLILYLFAGITLS